jgi:peptide deformylase
MTVRPIVITGEPVLHRRADPVAIIDDELRGLVADLFETMDAAHGVGLAAPQIGVGLRIFTWAMANDDGVPERGVVINPYVTASKPPSGRPDPDEEAEGCLSVPGESFPLKRGEIAQVTGQALDGRDLSFTATGWFARCMQHEYDHLGGFLYVDRLDERWTRRARKAVKAKGWGMPGQSWMPGVDPDPFGHDHEHDDDRGHDGHGHDGHDHDGHQHHHHPHEHGL